VLPLISGDDNPEGLIISWASEENHLSYRNIKRGSWYIEEITKVLEEHFESKNLVEMLDEVTTRVEKRRNKQGCGQRPTYQNGLQNQIFFNRQLIESEKNHFFPRRPLGTF